jgi:HAD superfamily hydrolase (TIGR01509 family)
VSVDALRRGEVEGRRRYDASLGFGVRESESAGGAPRGGRVANHEYFLGMLEACGIEDSLIARTLEAMDRKQRGDGLWARPVEGAREALDRIAALGLRCACVSNSDGRAEWHLERTGMRSGLEFVVDSHVVAVEKPDPAIFHMALDRLALPASRTLYVGDIRSVDEAGSRAAGMHFVLIDPFGDYAGDGGGSIRAIGELPGWIADRFTLPASRSA